MKTQKLVGVITAAAAIFALVAVLNSGNNTPLMRWPIEAYRNLVFAIGWLSPFPDALVFLIAVLVIVVTALAFYKLGSWVFGLLAR